MTSERLTTVFEDLSVQVTPSGEVRIVPLSPTATNWVTTHATRLRFEAVPVDCAVQASPSGEVKATPFAPTITTWLPDDATPRRDATPASRPVQVLPSAELTMTAGWP